MNRRDLFKLFGAAVAAPVVAKALPLHSNGPTLSDVHVNRALTKLSLRYLREAESTFLSGAKFPRLPISGKHDVYFRYTRPRRSLTAAETATRIGTTDSEALDR